MDNIAIAHKDYDVRGGGEVLAEELSRTFDAPLIVGHRDEDCEPDGSALEIWEIEPQSRWHSLMERGGALRGLAHMFHWRDHGTTALASYDTVITSGNEPLWMMPRDDQTVIAYTHSPPRWMYDLNHEVEGFIGRTYNQAQRRLYEGTVKRPDLWVANSDIVARRIRRYWDIPEEDVRVVYPPVETSTYAPDDAETEDWYLYLGRLAGHKCVDEVVHAFNQLGDDYQLKIAGRGPEEDTLRQQANDNIEFLGFVDEQAKRELNASAKALVYPPQNEDFGMVPIEAMAAGTPVIGVKEGFTKHQVLPQENGLLWPRQGGHLREAIRRFDREGVQWSESEIAEFASSNFSVAAFRDGMQQAVETAEERTRVEPELEAPGTVAQPARLTTDGGEGDE